jgi:hypothetical protein
MGRVWNSVINYEDDGRYTVRVYAQGLNSEDLLMLAQTLLEAACGSERGMPSPSRHRLSRARLGAECRARSPLRRQPGRPEVAGALRARRAPRVPTVAQGEYARNRENNVESVR